MSHYSHITYELPASIIVLIFLYYLIMKIAHWALKWFHRIICNLSTVSSFQLKALKISEARSIPDPSTALTLTRNTVPAHYLMSNFVAAAFIINYESQTRQNPLKGQCPGVTLS